MGEQVARAWAKEAGLKAHFDSAGTSDEELGNPIDPRAAEALREHGYPVGEHRAKQVTRKLIEASDLVLAFERMHLVRLQRLAPQTRTIRLVTDFDPEAEPGAGIPDPWYYGQSAFEATLKAIEAAMPGIIDTISDDRG